VLRHLSIIEVLAAITGNILCVDTATPPNEHQQSVNSASTERQQSINTASTECQQSVNDVGYCILCIPKAVLRHLSIIEVLAAFTGIIVCVDTATPPNERQQSVNRASTEGQQSINTASTECQQSVNDFGYGILYNPRALLWQISIIIVLAAVLSKSDRNMVTAPH